MVYVGFDGSRVHGYSMLSNSWSSRAIEGNLLALDANSASGFVLTDSHLYAYSPHGSLSTLSRFPSSRACNPSARP
ncbi:MAG: hypothetical protein R3E96_10275 [Planctomycetota bacterium]